MCSPVCATTIYLHMILIITWCTNQLILLWTLYVKIQLFGEGFNTGKYGRKEKKRMTWNKGNGLSMAIDAPSEDLKDRKRDRLTHNQSIIWREEWNPQGKKMSWEGSQRICVSTKFHLVYLIKWKSDRATILLHLYCSG